MIRRSFLILLGALLVLSLFAACGPDAQIEALSPDERVTARPAAAATAIPLVIDPPVYTASPVPVLSPTPTAAPTPIPVSDPVILLKGGESLAVNAAFTFEDPGFTARDYLGEDLTSRVVVTGTVTSYLVGEYALTYAVTDDYGNSTRIERTVTVQPVPLPELVPPPEKTIYLTFDDGPGDHTAVLLDILKKYDVKATFFVVGSRRRKDLIKRAFDEGHSIGVHTFTHDYDKMYTSLDAYFQDFLATQEVIRDQTGQYTTLFRFPGGSGNTASISRCRGLMTQLTKIMEDMGYRYFDWNCSAGDSNFHSGQTASHYNSVLCGKVKKDGSFTLILQHDLNRNSIQALDYFIPWALKKGYVFLPLDMTSPVVHSVVKN